MNLLFTGVPERRPPEASRQGRGKRETERARTASARPSVRPSDDDSHRPTDLTASRPLARSFARSSACQSAFKHYFLSRRARPLLSFRWAPRRRHRRRRRRGRSRSWTGRESTGLKYGKIKTIIREESILGRASLADLKQARKTDGVSHEIWR